MCTERPLLAGKQEQLVIGEQMSPCTLDQGAPRHTPSFYLNTVFAMIYWLILTSQARGKNLNPPLKAVLIIIQLHSHYSIFIMFGAIFQTLYIYFSLES